MAGIMNKLKDMWKPPEDEVEYEDNSYYDNESAVDDGGVYETEPPQQHVQRSAPRQTASRPSQSGSKVVNINSTARLQVVLFKPERFGEETRDIAVELMKMHTVLLNLENTNKDMARRILDFLSGVAFANQGKISRVASNTYMITPNNVDLTGEEVLDELESNGLYLSKLIRFKFRAEALLRLSDTVIIRKGRLYAYT